MIKGVKGQSHVHTIKEYGSVVNTEPGKTQRYYHMDSDPLNISFVQIKQVLRRLICPS